MFPEYSFIFTDKITNELLKETSAVFFGGGSFLFSAPDIEDLELLKTKSIFYIGVGAETDIHPIHKELIKISKLIALRSNSKLDYIKSLHKNVIVIPDIVMSLQDKVKISKRIDKSVLILPNISVVPTYDEPYWRHTSWNYFKVEFSQFLDYLIDNNYKVNFLAFCQGTKANDSFAAIEIINLMKNKINILNNKIDNISDITSIISRYSLVISQRFHGAILSDMTQTSNIIISHHDKLKNYGNHLSYYGISKQLLINNLNADKPSLPIYTDIFAELKLKVNDLIG
jgi:polysaccharide pyruvyl transferase WcaK-like protein